MSRSVAESGLLAAARPRYLWLMRPTRYSMIASLLLALSACGGATPEAATPPTPPTTATTPAPAPSTEAPKAAESPAAPEASAAPVAPPAPAHDIWSDDLSKEGKVAFMKKNVMPEMGPIFKGYDAKRYGEFGCKTCHGPKFKDPKEFLPALTFKDGKITAFAEKPQLAKFMAEQVLPHMVTALGVKPMDPVTHTGFGCNGCHTVKMK